eukprot:Clim_evm184s157 gene=Clim_evmTU184s157
MAKMDPDGMRAMYDDVRNDNSETAWAVFVYDDSNQIVPREKGTDYDALVASLKDDERAYVFLRIETGDELSKRAKFAFITWIGDNVGALKKAKVSTDKSSVKNVVQSYAVELMANDQSDMKFDAVKKAVVAAGGANYGTGTR